MSSTISSSLMSSLNTQSPAINTTSTASAGAQKNEFMRLLVAQLKNQDPMDPQKGADFVAQLAQFSALEQSAATNDKLDNLATAGASGARASMVSMVGKTVDAKADSIQVDASGGTPPVQLHLDGAAKSVKVDLVDANGTTVRSISLGATPAGDLPLNWAQASGGALPAGTYSVSVKATSNEGGAVSASPRIHGVIQSLAFDNAGGTQFRVGGATVSPSDILSVQG